jgi:hypothetical protein
MMAVRSNSGRVEPAIRIALTIRTFSGASYLDMMRLFRIAKYTVYEAFYRTIASITKRLAMPGLPSAHGDLQRIACSEVKSHLRSHLPTPLTRLYTQHTSRHPEVASINTMGEGEGCKGKLDL